MTSQLERLFEQHRVWRLLWLVGIIGVFYLATSPNPYPIPSSSNDKVNHIAAFTVLTGLFCLGFPGRQLRWAVTVMLAYGILIELVQSQLPYSDCSFWDVVADACGIGLALTLCLSLPFVRAPIRRRPQTADSDPSG